MKSGNESPNSPHVIPVLATKPLDQIFFLPAGADHDQRQNRSTRDRRKQRRQSCLAPVRDRPRYTSSKQRWHSAGPLNSNNRWPDAPWEMKLSKYETSLASEFYVLSVLYRIGADASLSLGNKKAVDITVVREAGDAATVDVKGVAGRYDWPADNISLEPRKRHFLVFVSFEGMFDDPRVLPSIWVVPHADVQQFRVQYRGRSNISRAKLVAEGGRYRESWHLLLGSG
jgi:hypothetical protein